MWCIGSTWNKCMFNGLIHNLTCNQTCARFTSGRIFLVLVFACCLCMFSSLVRSIRSLLLCVFARVHYFSTDINLNKEKIYSFLLSAMQRRTMCLRMHRFLFHMNSIQNLHKHKHTRAWMYAFSCRLYSQTFQNLCNIYMCTINSSIVGFVCLWPCLWLAWENTPWTRWTTVSR